LFCPDTPQGETIDGIGCSESDYARISEASGDDGGGISVLGWGIILSTTAALGVAFIATRRK
jgi:hypothetical protein